MREYDERLMSLIERLESREGLEALVERLEAGLGAAAPATRLALEPEYGCKRPIATMKNTLLTAAQVAAALHCSLATVRRHAPDLGGFKPPEMRGWLFASDRVESLAWVSSETAGEGSRG